MPKTKVSPDCIVNAAFELVRESGASQMNVRNIAKKIGCSTQPVLWHFKSISDIRRAVYEKTNIFHSDQVMNLTGSDPLRALGMNYIRFAANEKHLFRFLFQSDMFSGQSLSQLIESEEITPILTMIMERTKLNHASAKSVFKTLFLYVHGYASMLANNAMQYDEHEISNDLNHLPEFAVLIARKGESHDKETLR